MNFYRRWGRWVIYVRRDPKPTPLATFEEMQAATAILEMSLLAARFNQADEYAADDAHPFQNAEALQGNIITPAGAQSGFPINQRDEE